VEQYRLIADQANVIRNIAEDFDPTRARRKRALHNPQADPFFLGFRVCQNAAFVK
jgi:hypothetical protein